MSMQLKRHEFTTPLTCPKDQYFKTQYVPESMFNFCFLEFPVLGIKKVYFLNQFSN